MSMKMVFVFFAAVAIISGYTARAQACPKGWIYWLNSCYYKPNKEENQKSAVAYCKKFGATLVNIDSEEENSFVDETFVAIPPYTWTYIGVVREKSGRNRFVTTERKPQTYFKWGKYEPNNWGPRGENCVEMRKKLWNDIGCSNKLHFVCEYKVNNNVNNPCRNDGRFVDSPPVYKCVCKHPFYGTHCEHKFIGCAKGWIAFGYHCYRAFPGARPWNVAGIKCRTANGNLPVVQSKEENAFLHKNFPKQNFWIGTTECLCGKRCSVDFTKVNFSQWDTCEPRELDEAKGCAMLEERTGNWKNRDCEEKHNVVCKREPIIVHEAVAKRFERLWQISKH